MKPKTKSKHVPMTPDQRLMSQAIPLSEHEIIRGREMYDDAEYMASIRMEGHRLALSPGIKHLRQAHPEWFERDHRQEWEKDQMEDPVPIPADELMDMLKEREE